MPKKLKKVVAVADGGKLGQANPDKINALLESLNLNGFAKSTLDHNRFTTLFGIIAVTLFVVVRSIQPPMPTAKDPFVPQPTAKNSLTPVIPVEVYSTASDLKKHHDAMVDDLNSQIAASKQRVADMQIQVEIAQRKIQQENQALAGVIQTVAAVGAPFAGPFAPVVLAGAGLLTLGLGLDNGRKRSKAAASSTDATQADDTTDGTGSTDLSSALQQLLMAIPTAIGKSNVTK